MAAWGPTARRVDFPLPTVLRRSDSADLYEALLAPESSAAATNRPSCTSCGAMTADTDEEMSSSFSSMLSSDAPPAPGAAAAPARKMASAAFFEASFFAQAQSSSLSLPDDDLMTMGAGASQKQRRSSRRRGARRREPAASKTGTVPYQLERAMALEVPGFPTELLLLDLDAGASSSRRDGSSRRRSSPNSEAALTHRRTREDEDAGVIPTIVSAPVRNQEARPETRESSPSRNDSTAAPAAIPYVVCQCCYEEIDPQSTMPTYTCSAAPLAGGDDDDTDDDEFNALPPKPPLPRSNGNNNHAVCAHCLAAYVHEWVFGGTSYPLRKQQREQSPLQAAGAPNQSTPGAGAAASSSTLPPWAWELPCLSPDCPNGSYPRSVVQEAISSQAMVQYDAKLQRMYDGANRTRAVVAAAATAADTVAAPPDADPARPPSPPRNRDQLYREETLTERRIRRCAVCCAPFVKESNTCNKIRCPHCNFRFCFVCLTDLPAKGYDHFCTHQYDSACDVCVREGITCHLWSHEVDESEANDSDADLDGAEIAKADINQQEQPPKRRGFARDAARAGKGKNPRDQPRTEAERFLKKLLLPARKGHNKP